MIGANLMLCVQFHNGVYAIYIGLYELIS